MTIYLDIETIPCIDPNLIADIEKTIKAPGQFKKPDSIAKWMEENKESELERLVSKTSLDGMYGRVACIAWAFDDQVIFSTKHDMSEEDVIKEFYYAIQNDRDMSYSFCGHNIAGFDLPFLKHRSMVLGIRPPGILLSAMNAKPWDECIQDTMLMWSSDRQKMASMDKLCKVFGIEGKDDMDGSKVAETWLTNPQKVVDYCIDDVRRTLEIYKRLTFAVKM